MIINEIDKTNRQIVNDFIINHWYTLEMVVRGKDGNYYYGIFSRREDALGTKTIGKIQVSISE